MNSITEYQPPCADALRSLTLPAPPDRLPSPARLPWRWSLPMAGLSLAVVAVWLVMGGAPWTGTAAPVAPVTITPNPVVPPPREISGAGYVVAPAQVTIFAEGPGRVVALMVQPGDRVAAGQVLIVLQNIDAEFALEQAQAARRAADLTLAARRIERDRAEASFARSAALAAGQALSQQQFETAKAARDLAGNAVLQADEALRAADLKIRMARQRLEDLTIRAPIAGTVTRLNARVGDRVLAQADDPGAAQSLVTVTDTSSLVIDADVAETSFAQLKPGQRGEAVLDAWPDHPFAVEVQAIAPVISPEKGVVSLRLRLLNPPPGIRPAMAARIRINTETGESQQ